MKKIVHYINQFFGGIGGEESADYKPEIKNGAIGPGLALEKSLIDAEISHTVICGDNYMGTHPEEAIKEILSMLEKIDFDIFVAGPAFQAGRYGVACGNICKAVKEHFHVPVLSSMHSENPGVEMFKTLFPIFIGGHSAAQMQKDTKKMALYVNKLVSGESLGSASENDYFPRGVRHQVFLKNPISAAERGVDMLIKKLNGRPYHTELIIPKKDIVPCAPPIRDLTQAKIAILTTGGIVPVDNPDRIQSASATRWGRYYIGDMDRLKSGEFKTIHAGFDPAAADADPNVIVPIDVLKDMLEEGVYGALHPYFYSTVGTGTTQAESSRMGKEMIAKLQEDHVDGVIMIST